MLTELRIKNFKAWKDTGAVRLAPLTVIFGTNSSGKSSLGHLLLALKQTVLLTDRKRALHLGDETSLIDLGTFADCLYAHDLKQSLEFSMRWRLPQPMTVRNALNSKEQYRGSELRLSSVLHADKTEQPQTQSIAYELIDGQAVTLRVRHSRSKVDCDPLKLVHAVGRKWPVEPPEKFYRFADRTLLRYQNADFLASLALQAEHMLERLYFLGPLRRPPRRVYQWSGDTPPDVGAQGEYAIAALLAATQEGRQLNRGYRKHVSRFDAFIAAWLRDLGVIDSFRVEAVSQGRKDFEVLVRTHPGGHDVRLTDVGFGVSQVLPALVQAFYAPAGSTVWMEQPEIHLHPSAQANLADVFISAIKSYEGGQRRDMQLIVETHSEHFLTRLQRHVAEGEIEASDVAVYFVKRDSATAQIEALRLNMFGDIENWPTNFFGDEMGDVAARSLAALKRQHQDAGPGGAV
jgi:predicted ATPase